MSNIELPNDVQNFLNYQKAKENLTQKAPTQETLARQFFLNKKTPPNERAKVLAELLKNPYSITPDVLAQLTKEEREKVEVVRDIPRLADKDLAIGTRRAIIAKVGRHPYLANDTFYKYVSDSELRAFQAKIDKTFSQTQKPQKFQQPNSGKHQIIASPPSRTVRIFKRSAVIKKQDITDEGEPRAIGQMENERKEIPESLNEWIARDGLYEVQKIVSETALQNIHNHIEQKLSSFHKRSNISNNHLVTIPSMLEDQVPIFEQFLNYEENNYRNLLQRREHQQDFFYHTKDFVRYVTEVLHLADEQGISNTLRLLAMTGQFSHVDSSSGDKKISNGTE